MNTNNKNENTPVPALMRKTKAQLIDIILRKDNIECNLRNDIKSKDNTIDNYKEKLAKSTRKIDTVKHEYETLNAEFQSTCDENASTICELKETIMHNKCSIFRLYIWLVASFIIIILCLCCL